jgi:hypothetical protein
VGSSLWTYTRFTTKTTYRDNFCEKLLGMAFQTKGFGGLDLFSKLFEIP